MPNIPPLFESPRLVRANFTFTKADTNQEPNIDEGSFAVNCFKRPKHVVNFISYHATWYTRVNNRCDTRNIDL